MKRITAARSAYFVAALATAHATSPAYAISCRDKPELFSKNWFLSKVDCGVDQLLKKGTSAAIDMAKNLGKAWVNAYVPMLADLLFGKDSSAAQTKIILDAIDQSRRDVMQAMVGLVYDETLGVTWPRIQDKVTTYSSEPFWVSLGRFQGGYYATLEDNMDRTRVQLQVQENVFRLDGLHTLTTLVDMQITMQPSISYWAAIIGRGITEQGLQQLSPEQRNDIQMDADYSSRQMVKNLLTGVNGSLLYFEGLARQNRYRTYSDQSFSPLQANYSHLTLGYQGRKNPIADHFEVIYRYDIVRLETSITNDTTEATRQEVRDPATPIHVKIPVTASCGLTTAVCSSYVATGTLPDGTNVTQYGTSVDDAARRVRDLHKNFAYRNSLVAAYGGVRPVTDRWYRGLGRAIPTFAADNDLNNIILSYSCSPSEGCSGPMFELVQLFYASRDRPLTPSSDPNLPAPIISASDRRAVTNYVIQNGSNALTSMRWSAFANDPWAAGEGGPSSKEYLQLIRAEADQAAVTAAFRGRFAAKVMSVL